ncbi:hypothetical protein [Schaalia sp. lx-100]|uniref:hypothetical protein n=1 Tax=Schaalia sp. lx-100 TaxID=2899081 RepID=UPI001E48104C|nr:hypothetical protein [Schaalia sp. lx-100]MCD4557200.1 hypothetical protein [Schaalia sp. lx-100]
MGNPLHTGEIDRILSEIFENYLGESGLSLRRLSEISGVKLTRLGDVLRRGKAMTGNEIHAIAAAFHRSGWRVFREAEERLTSGEPLIHSALFEAASPPQADESEVIELPTGHQITRADIDRAAALDVGYAPEMEWDQPPVDDEDYSQVPPEWDRWDGA